MQPNMPPILVKMQRVGGGLSHWGPVVGRAFGLYAPAVLGWITILIATLWLTSTRYTEPRDAELDGMAVTILQLWVIATIMGAVAVPLIRQHWQLPPARSPRSIAGLAHAALVRGPALLWLFFCLNAMTTLNSPPPGMTAEQRSLLQMALAIWLATTAVVLVIQGLWCLCLARRALRQLQPAGASESPQ